MIKGLGELNIAPVQADALEMILIRIAYSSSLPTPAEILDGLKKNSNLAAEPSFSSQNGYPSQRVSIEQKRDDGFVVNSAEDLVNLFTNAKKVMLVYSLKNDISFIEISHGFMKISVSEKITDDFLLSLQNSLIELTGTKWQIDVVKGPLGETLADKEEAQTREQKKDIMELPLVRAILAEFNGAQIESLTRKVTPKEDEKQETFFEEQLFNEEDM